MEEYVYVEWEDMYNELNLIIDDLQQLKENS